jgi:hypothetical protein
VESEGGAIRGDTPGNEFGIGTVRGVARASAAGASSLGRCTNRRRGSSPRGAGLLAGLMPFIEAILTRDRQAPRKQRHTGHRIWQRIRAEWPEQVVAESTIGKYVRERKRELGWSTRTTCVPQSYAPGRKSSANPLFGGLLMTRRLAIIESSFRHHFLPGFGGGLFAATLVSSNTERRDFFKRSAQLFVRLRDKHKAGPLGVPAKVTAHWMPYSAALSCCPPPDSGGGVSNDNS